MRRFLVLTPVSLGVSTVAFVTYSAVSTGGSIRPEVETALFVALVGVAIVLVAVFLAARLLRPLGVDNAWAALSLALGLATVAMGITYAGAEPDEWGMLLFEVAVGVQVPAWLTYAVGLLAGDLRNRAARRRVDPTDAA
ncbi:hypothetical protein GCM10010413_37070 [Promicromonospora sukumoe]